MKRVQAAAAIVTLMCSAAYTSPGLAKSKRPLAGTAGCTTGWSDRLRAVVKNLRYDTDRDCRLSRTEWREAEWTGLVRRNDRNDDGVITRDEFVSATCPIDMVAYCTRTLVDGLFGTATSLDHRRFMTANEPYFDENDINHDGYVTVAEMASGTP